MKVRLTADHIFDGAVVPKGTLIGGEGMTLPADFAVSHQMELLDDEAKKALAARDGKPVPEAKPVAPKPAAGPTPFVDHRATKKAT